MSLLDRNLTRRTFLRTATTIVGAGALGGAVPRKLLAQSPEGYLPDLQVTSPNAAPDDSAIVLVRDVLDYSLSGGTAPTDNHGNTGTLDGGSLTADFTNQTVTNDLAITIGGDTWQATGQGSISSGAPVFNGSYDVTRGSGATGTGDFSGFFGGAPLPSGAPSGAGVGYSLESGATTVNGAAAFTAQQ